MTDILTFLTAVAVPWAAWLKRPKAPIPICTTLHSDVKKVIRWRCDYYELAAEITIIVVGSIWFFGLVLILLMAGEEQIDLLERLVGRLLLVLLATEWIVVALGHLSLKAAKDNDLIE